MDAGRNGFTNGVVLRLPRATPTPAGVILPWPTAVGPPGCAGLPACATDCAGLLAACATASDTRAGTRAPSNKTTPVSAIQRRDLPRRTDKRITLPLSAQPQQAGATFIAGLPFPTITSPASTVRQNLPLMRTIRAAAAAAGSSRPPTPLEEAVRHTAVGARGRVPCATGSGWSGSCPVGRSGTLPRAAAAGCSWRCSAPRRFPCGRTPRCSRR
jgi:hypothetical protein